MSAVPTKIKHSENEIDWKESVSNWSVYISCCSARTTVTVPLLGKLVIVSWRLFISTNVLEQFAVRCLWLDYCQSLAKICDKLNLRPDAQKIELSLASEKGDAPQLAIFSSLC